MGLLSTRSPRELLARRSGAIVAVVSLHVLAVSVLLHMRYSDRPTAEPVAIRVANFQIHDVNDEPAPELEVQLMPPPEFEVVVPLVHISMPSPPVTAITPPPPPPPTASVRQVVHDAAPVMLDASEVDYLHRTNPSYPRAAKQARVEGTVLLWVVIGPDGKPREVRIHQTSGSEQLDRAARDAVRQWVFKPYKRDGVALSAQVIVPMEFTLTQRGAKRS